MSKYIAFLRGINVGGNKKVLMEDLRKLCEVNGFKNVRTYIQSGNVLLESNLNEKSVRDKLEKGLKDEYKTDISL